MISHGATLVNFTADIGQDLSPLDIRGRKVKYSDHFRRSLEECFVGSCGWGVKAGMAPVW